MVVELGKVSQQTKGPTGQSMEAPVFPNSGLTG
jgi:hypothetical protein